MISRLLPIVFLAFAIIGGQASAAPKNAPVAPSPALWRVSDSDSSIYLFGTYGVVPEGATWRSRAVAGAIDASETVWFEASAADPSARESANKIFATEGMLGEGQSLFRLIGADRAAALTGIAEETGAPIASLDALKPWAAFVVLSGAAQENSEVKLSEAIDAALLSEAQSRGRKIRYLDSVENSLGALTAMPENVQIDLLASLIGDWARQRREAAAGFDAWRRGDAAAIDANLNAPMRRKAPDAYRRLVVERNAALADMLGEILGGRDTAFVAVNAGYVVGADALPARLAERGFTVEWVGEKP